MYEILAQDSTESVDDAVQTPVVTSNPTTIATPIHFFLFHRSADGPLDLAPEVCVDVTVEVSFPIGLHNPNRPLCPILQFVSAVNLKHAKASA